MRSRATADAAMLLAVAGALAACGRRSDEPPSARQAPVAAPDARVPPPPCTFANQSLVGDPRIASRELVRAGDPGPWIAGQAVFEYVSPAARTPDDRYLNANDSGGTSVVEAGARLAFVLPANRTLPRESLLRYGPPPVLAFRATAPGEYRVDVVACATRHPPPHLELEVSRRTGASDPVSTLPVEHLVHDAGVRPVEEHLWFAPATTIAPRMERTADVRLGEGDVVMLVAVGAPSDAADRTGMQEVAFDVAVAPR